MLEAKVIEGHPDRIVVMYREDLEAQLAAARAESETALVGRRWTVDDVLKRLSGYQRGKLTSHVLVPKSKELKQIGALLTCPASLGGTDKRWLFRATVMSHWLEDNLEQITKGGWK